MEASITFLMHLVALVIIFGLLYWLITLVCSIIPAPVQAPIRVILLVILVLIAISVLTGELGVWGDWGMGYRHHR